MPDSSSPQPHVPAETKGRHKTIAVVAGEWHLRALVRAAIENKRTSVVEPAVNSMPGRSVGGMASSTSEATTIAPLTAKNHLRMPTRSSDRIGAAYPSVVSRAPR